MQRQPEIMACRAGGVRIETPAGEVWLRPTPQGIQAEYARGPLVNGSATAYAGEVKQAALDYSHALDLPWSSDGDATIRINDHQRYYEQTFRPDLLAAETLLRWESRSCASQTGT